jgi:hypothetical protein
MPLVPAKGEQVEESKAPEHEEVSLDGWAFPDSPHTECYSTRRVMSGDHPITRVFHDSEDGAWQFHGPEESTIEDAVLVCLHCIVEKDVTVKTLADLPAGWCAWRDDVSSPWTRSPLDKDAEEV